MKSLQANCLSRTILLGGALAVSLSAAEAQESYVRDYLLVSLTDVYAANDLDPRVGNGAADQAGFDVALPDAVGEYWPEGEVGIFNIPAHPDANRPYAPESVVMDYFDFLDAVQAALPYNRGGIIDFEPVTPLPDVPADPSDPGFESAYSAYEKALIALAPDPLVDDSAAPVPDVLLGWREQASDQVGKSDIGFRKIRVQSLGSQGANFIDLAQTPVRSESIGGDLQFIAGNYVENEVSDKTVPYLGVSDFYSQEGHIDYWKPDGGNKYPTAIGVASELVSGTPGSTQAIQILFRSSLGETDDPSEPVGAQAAAIEYVSESRVRVIYQGGPLIRPNGSNFVIILSGGEAPLSNTGTFIRKVPGGDGDLWVVARGSFVTPWRLGRQPASAAPSGVHVLSGATAYDLTIPESARVTVAGFTVVGYNNFQSYQEETAESLPWYLQFTDPGSAFNIVENAAWPDNIIARVDFSDGSFAYARQTSFQCGGCRDPFFGFQSPGPGIYITRISVNQSGRNWRAFIRMDDIAFVQDAPEEKSDTAVAIANTVEPNNEETNEFRYLVDAGRDIDFYTWELPEELAGDADGYGLALHAETGFIQGMVRREIGDNAIRVHEIPVSGWVADEEAEGGNRLAFKLNLNLRAQPSGTVSRARLGQPQIGIGQNVSAIVGQPFEIRLEGTGFGGTSTRYQPAIEYRLEAVNKEFVDWLESGGTGPVPANNFYVSNGIAFSSIFQAAVNVDVELPEDGQLAARITVVDVPAYRVFFAQGRNEESGDYRFEGRRANGQAIAVVATVVPADGKIENLEFLLIEADRATYEVYALNADGSLGDAVDLSADEQVTLSTRAGELNTRLPNGETFEFTYPGSLLTEVIDGNPETVFESTPVGGFVVDTLQPLGDTDQEETPYPVTMEVSGEVLDATLERRSSRVRAVGVLSGKVGKVSSYRYILVAENVHYGLHDWRDGLENSGKPYYLNLFIKPATPEPNFNPDTPTDLLFSGSSDALKIGWLQEENGRISLDQESLSSGQLFGAAGNGFVLGDYNGDGVLDAAQLDASTGHVNVGFFYADGEPSFEEQTVIDYLGADTAWELIASGDFDGDRTDDLLYHNPQTGLWVIHFIEAARFRWPLTLSLPESGMAVAYVTDFNGDQIDDLLFLDQAGGYRVLLLAGRQILAPLSAPLAGIGAADVLSEVVDFNQDGIADLFLTNTESGEVRLVLMQGGSVLDTIEIANTGRQGFLEAVFDFDDDSYLDILWRSLNGEMQIRFYNENMSSDRSSTFYPYERWDIASIGFYNTEDRFADLLLRDRETGDLYIMLLNVDLDTGAAGASFTSMILSGGEGLTPVRFPADTGWDRVAYRQSLIDAGERPAWIWDDAEPLGNNWYHLDWFGFFYVTPTQYIYHIEHGWTLVPSTSTDSLILGDAKLGWLWTAKDYYPNLYQYRNAFWLWYAPGSVDPRWFYIYAFQLWESEDGSIINP